MNEKYIPLYRKYRPQKLEEIVGQEHIKKALANAVSMNRISHAYLFTGPRGTGKTSTARIFAKSLNCEKGPTISPCNECENCKNITNSIPIDVVEIDAASNRSVNDADELVRKIALTALQSRYKIYIIDEVHMLTKQAFNALLKTLEEPPENVIFILATTEVHQVLDTIKSRCQRFDFRRITTDDIVKHLRYISDKEGINITDDALYTIAKNSAGGMRDSIALLDQISILNGEQAISTDDINSMLGRISFDVLNKLSSAITESNPQAAVEILENIYNSGNEPSLILSNLLDYFKNLLIVKNCNPQMVFELTQLNEIQIKELTEQVKDIETHQITSLIEKTADYIKEVKRTNNPRLWLEVGIIDLANLTENTKLAELQSRLINLEGGNVTVNTSPAFKMSPPAPVKTPQETMKKIKEQILAEKNKPETEQTKPDKSEPAVAAQAVTKKDEEQLPEVSEVKEIKPEPKTVQTEDFSPMPKSKPAAGDDIATLWAKVLENITSAPTKALLKQWANPVEITPDRTIVTIKNEGLLSQFTAGNKKAMLAAAVDKLFSQQNSDVIVRLPQAGDIEIKNIATPPSKPNPVKSEVRTEQQQVQETPDEEDLQSAISDVKSAEQENNFTETGKKHFAGYSEQVNMVVDLFDGKIIE